MKGSEAEKFLDGKMPTSLDGMSPKNPGLLALAEIPVLPPIKSHSIISVEGDGDYHKGRDGLVSYASAHQDYTKSEFIVRSFHTCLNYPATIQECGASCMSISKSGTKEPKCRNSDRKSRC